MTARLRSKPTKPDASNAHRSWSWRRCVFPASLLAIALTPQAGAAEQAFSELAKLSIEELLNVKLVSASRYAQSATEAPASVTVITADDIRTYGYRTLADVLRSVRGFYVTNDRNYSYLGVRGFAPPGDYNDRVLVMVDGIRLNEPIYDSFLAGEEFPLDLNTVARVEVIRGPSSSVYGGNALFGVVNVITRRGADIDGMELAGAVSSYQGRKARATFGKKFDSGLDLIISASGFKNSGPNLYFPEFSGINGGFAQGTDHERSKKLFLKISYDAFAFTAGYGARAKGMLSGAFGATFDDAGNVLEDRLGFADLSYTRQFGRTELLGRLFYGNYEYESIARYTSAPTVPYRDLANGRWWGSELKLVNTTFDKHKIVAGIEYRHNYRQTQTSYDIEPYALYQNDRRREKRLGLFIQDEYALGDDWLLNAGLRYDKISEQAGAINPRLALIYKLSEATTAKLLYGTAFRTANVYETRYQLAGFQIDNPSLKPEKIKTYEAMVEHRLRERTKLTLAGYFYRMDGLISQVTDPVSGLLQFQNVDGVRAHGLEAEIDHVGVNGRHLRASASHQRTRDSAGVTPANSPANQLKINLAIPLNDKRIRLGVDSQFMSHRATTIGRSGGYGVTNLTLNYQPYKFGPQLTASVYNVFDRRFADPISPDISVPQRDAVVQNGRTLRLALEQKF